MQELTLQRAASSEGSHNAMPGRLNAHQKLFRADRYTPRSSGTFISNFAKMRSHFAFSRQSRQEPHVHRTKGASGGSGLLVDATRNGRYLLDVVAKMLTSKLNLLWLIILENAAAWKYGLYLQSTNQDRQESGGLV